MVKSKKMSKTSIAVIVLALLLVLSMVMGITGAWFTDKDVKTANKSASAVLGNIGGVEISVATNQWQHHPDGGELANVGDARDYVMPGDLLTSGSVTFTYTAAAENAAPVYYAIKVGNEFYEFDGPDAIKTLAANKCGTFSAGAECVLPGNVATVTLTGDHAGTYALDGNIVDREAGPEVPEGVELPYESYKLPEIGTIVLNSGAFSITNGAVIYKIAIIQQANMSEATARGLLEKMLLFNN